LVVILTIILVGGLLAFSNYQKTKSSSQQTSYPLNLGNILAPSAFLNGVPVGPELTPNHGQLVQIEIYVMLQHGFMSPADFINPVGWEGQFTNSTHTIGQTIIIYRIYQDGYAETTNGTILLTQQILGITHARGLGESGPIPQAFFIPAQQWVPEGV
jgi:hypothetical protein